MELDTDDADIAFPLILVQLELNFQVTHLLVTTPDESPALSISKHNYSLYIHYIHYHYHLLNYIITVFSVLNKNLTLNGRHASALVYAINNPKNSNNFMLYICSADLINL